MKHLLFLLFLVGLLAPATAQVKDKFRKEATTVVVKETGSTDLEVLNSQFNLSSVGMNDVIMIATTSVEPAKVKSTKTSEKVALKKKKVYKPAPPRQVIEKAPNGVYKRKKVKSKGKKRSKRKRTSRKIKCYSF